jgi:hypothetical protein
MREDTKGSLTEGLGFTITGRERSDLVDAFELTEDERGQFDYLDWAAIDNGRDSATFFRRRGELHDLGNFMLTQEGGDLRRFGYHGFAADSAFSGIAVHLDPDGESVISALVLS